MRRFVIVGAASAALLAGLGACSDGNESDGASAAVPVAPVVVVTPTAASADPYAWTDIRYEDYLKAAEQLGIRPDMLRPLAGFSSGLSELCHTAPAQFGEMRQAQLTNTANTETYSAAQYMHDEVALRIGLACPQRMADWTATNTGEDTATGGSESDGSEAAVTDEDLARAAAEEKSEAPDWDTAGYNSGGSAQDTTVDSIAAPTEAGTATPAP